MFRSESMFMIVVLQLTWCLTKVIYANNYQCVCKLSVRRGYWASWRECVYQQLSKR